MVGSVGKASLPAKSETGALLPRLWMTRALAEKVAVGDRKGARFNGVAFLQSLKK